MPRLYKEDVIPVVVVILIIAAAVVWLWVWLTPPQARAATPAFDHSDCQYPYRWSNPPDGCDNSDPAVPECIKAATTQAAEQACIAAFVKQKDESTPISTPTTPPASSQPVTQPNPSTCTGK